jgi:hypothetical protein
MAITTGDFARGFEFATKAQGAQATRAGDALCKIASFLQAEEYSLKNLHQKL